MPKRATSLLNSDEALFLTKAKINGIMTLGNEESISILLK